MAARARSNEVGPLGLVEPKGAGQGVEHLLGHAVQVPPLEAYVVVRGDASEVSDLFPAQALYPAVPAVHRKAGLLRRDLGPGATPGTP